MSMRRARQSYRDSAGWVIPHSFERVVDVAIRKVEVALYHDVVAAVKAKILSIAHANNMNISTIEASLEHDTGVFCYFIPGGTVDIYEIMPTAAEWAGVPMPEDTTSALKADAKAGKEQLSKILKLFLMDRGSVGPICYYYPHLTRFFKEANPRQFKRRPSSRTFDVAKMIPADEMNRSLILAASLGV